MRHGVPLATPLHFETQDKVEQKLQTDLYALKQEVSAARAISERGARSANGLATSYIEARRNSGQQGGASPSPQDR